MSSKRITTKIQSTTHPIFIIKQAPLTSAKRRTHTGIDILFSPFLLFVKHCLLVTIGLRESRTDLVVPLEMIASIEARCTVLASVLPDVAVVVIIVAAGGFHLDCLEGRPFSIS